MSKENIQKQRVLAKEQKWATVRLAIDRKHCEKPTSGTFWLQGAEYFAAVPPFIADAFQDLINNWHRHVLAQIKEIEAEKVDHAHDE